MAVTASPIFPQALVMGVQNIKNADASTLKTLITGGANGTKVVSVQATSTETASARVIALWLTRNAVSYLITSVNVPVNSGFDGTTATIDLMNITQNVGLPAAAGTTAFDGQTYIILQYNDTLQVSSTTTVTAGKEIDLVAMAWNY